MPTQTRRDALQRIALGSGALAAAACQPMAARVTEKPMDAPIPATSAAPRVAPAQALDPIVRTEPLGAPPWPTPDPFLFCVHHRDDFPAGDGSYGPRASLAGRDIGQDFGGKDGWNMYHGERVPGFPSHPHRGFETVTVVRRGLVDHADSLGAAARYGDGDVQWLTAGRGIVHAEMFPLLATERGNPMELFQIWLNLPARDKFAEPHFTMFWADQVPRRVERDKEGRTVEWTVVAGAVGDLQPPAPPPKSWAARPEADVAIWTLRMDPGARATLPPARPGSNRVLYFFGGKTLQIGAREVARGQAVTLRADVATALLAGAEPVDVLVLQGNPIGEPVARYGPFVMNTRAEIQQAYSDYQRTRFGGWPWPASGPVHGGEPLRFAKRPDGTVEVARGQEQTQKG